MQNNTNNTIQLNDNSTVTVNGVIYFKFDSGFEGDYDKGCGLTGNEIDRNFYFLRGYDIKSIETADGNLIIQRVNDGYDPIVIHLAEDLKETFSFDKDHGVLTVTYADGTTEEIGGFVVDGKDVKVATDTTLVGDGTSTRPLRLSGMERTGTYAPANDFVDWVETDVVLDPKEKGYRVVTREVADNFGMLYPFEAVEELQRQLEAASSPWRVPTKEDWDELLNAMECAHDRNHSGITAGYYGALAGMALKSADDLWRPYSGECPSDVAGRDIVGFRAFPLGNCPERNEMMEDPDHDAEGFGSFGSFWANTKDEQGNGYAKSFVYNTTRVKQNTLGENAKMSIRLVKDYNYNNAEAVENILGLDYTTTLVESPFEDFPYTKVWTSQNVYDPNPSLSGVTSQEWSAATGEIKREQIVYFVNEWDGMKWYKKQLRDGDSIVIENYEKDGEVIRYHEWRVIDGELIDTVEAIKEEIKEELDEILDEVHILEGQVSDLSGTTVAHDEWIVSATTEIEHINENIENITTELHEAEGKIENLSASTEENIQRLDETINEFSASTDEKFGEIDAELVRLNNNDLVPGDYVLSGESDSEMVVPTKGGEESVKIKVSDDFFDFGKF